MKQTLMAIASSAISTPLHLERLQRIDSEDFTKVTEKVRSDAAKLGIHLSNQFLNNGVLALKQYYAVAMLDPANGHALSEVLDPFWHAHMLFSQDYTDFCVDVVGEYMHHVPLSQNDRAQVERVRFLYDYTILILPTLFTKVSDEFWPAVVTDAHLICYHKGNQGIYTHLQSARMFEPDVRLST